MAKTALDEPDPKLAASYASAERQWSLQFLRSPVEVFASEGCIVSGLKLAKNRYVRASKENKRQNNCNHSEPSGFISRLITKQVVLNDGLGSSPSSSSISGHNIHYLKPVLPSSKPTVILGQMSYLKGAMTHSRL